MEEAVVRTGCGYVSGRFSRHAFEFLGIPYASPPFGSLRLRPPRPAPAWGGTLSASDYGATAPKGEYPARYRRFFHEVDIPGDSCLNLNVWTPGWREGPGWPVLVWIHGGSFTNGSGSLPEYAGNAFARDGVVCVTFNYRLAADGFLALDDGTPNLGIMDQIQLLRWVQENIRAFGGDPGKVTIAGESAGANSVLTLISLEETRGLFSRAISQSCYITHILSYEDARRVTRALCREAGIPTTVEAVEGLDVAKLVTLAAELAADVETGDIAKRWSDLEGIGSAFGPCVDGRLVRQSPIEAISDGAGIDVPLLLGWTKDEGRLSLVSSGKLPRIDVSEMEKFCAGLGLKDRDIDVYRRQTAGSIPGDALAMVLTDCVFAIPTTRVAEARAQVNPKRDQTWVYRFDHPAPGSNGGLGAAHGVDLPYVFDVIELADVRARVGPAPSQAAADNVHGIWVSFIQGKPPPWPSFELDRRTMGLLSSDVVSADDPERERREVWSDLI